MKRRKLVPKKVRVVLPVLLLQLGWHTVLYSQQAGFYTIKGRLVDSVSNIPIAGGKVVLTESGYPRQSFYIFPLPNGTFEYTIILPKKFYDIEFNCAGYNTRTLENVLLDDLKLTDFKEIYLKPLGVVLQEVVVVKRLPPVAIRKDTIEYTAAGFMANPDAVLADIINQLPGFAITADGNITVYGRRVTRLTLEGQDFFGGDPKMALRNLPKNIIDKIQVSDYRTLEAKFNKLTDKSETVVINLTLRKDIKQGWFGQAGMGKGADNWYEAMTNLNYLKGTTMLSVIGNAGNTGRGGNMGGDIIINDNSAARGALNGITDSKTAGINYSEKPGNKLQLSGSYYFNSNSNSNVVKSIRQNILPDTVFYYHSLNNTLTANKAHQWAFVMDYSPAEATNIRINTTVGFNRSNMYNLNAAFSNGVSGSKINSSNNLFTAAGTGSTAATELFVGHRFKKRGGAITLRLGYNFNGQSSAENITGNNKFFAAGGGDSIHQQNLVTNSGKGIVLAASWAGYLAKKVSLVLEYSYQKNANDLDKSASRYNPATGKYDIADTVYSNRFHNSTAISSPAIRLSFVQKNFQLNAGLGVQTFTQNSFTGLSNANILQRYTNITPSLQLSYTLNDRGSIYFYYNGRSEQPLISQLQPIPDNRNPMYILKGNPQLAPSFFNSFAIAINQAKSNKYWSGSLNYTSTVNQVMYTAYYDPQGRQVSIPENVNGNYQVAANYHYSQSVGKGDGMLRFNFSGTGGFGRNKTFINKLSAVSGNYSFSQTAGISYSYKQLISVLPSFTVRFNKTDYSIASVHATVFIAKTAALGVICNYPRRLTIESGLLYSYNNYAVDGFSKGIILWNMAAGCRLFKKQQATVRVTVYDILEQNTGTVRDIADTYSEDIQSTILQRYFLISLICNLRSSAK